MTKRSHQDIERKVKQAFLERMLRGNIIARSYHIIVNARFVVATKPVDWRIEAKWSLLGDEVSFSEWKVRIGE